MSGYVPPGGGYGPPGGAGGHGPPSGGGYGPPGGGGYGPPGGGGGYGPPGGGGYAPPGGGGYGPPGGGGGQGHGPPGSGGPPTGGQGPASFGSPSPSAGAPATAGDGALTRPKRRVSPNVVLAVNVCALGATVAARTGSALNAFALSMLSSAVAGIATLAFFALFAAMLIDLKNLTRDPDFHWWFVFLPFYNVYWTLTVVREQVRKARVAAGQSPQIRSGALYFFLPAWALALDIDDFSDP